jgi:DNA replication protein DnaC
MILEAAKLSSGKNSPMAYVNVVLSNWKNNGVFSTENIQTPSTPNSQEEYNREYEKRRKLAHSTAQKNMDSAMALEGFSELYGRLNSMEKDLAFAEISGDSNALKALEQEQENIKERIASLLETINLTISDLSPKFRCDKCNDTGYVGTHKCDCY